MSEGESIVEIVYGEAILMSISDNDAIWNNISKQELAQKKLQIISQAIQETTKRKLARLPLLKKLHLL